MDSTAFYERPKFLLVDDIEANLLALEKVLSGLDVELFKAKSGEESLKLMLKHEFALALLDVQMPEMDGYELAEIMRGDPHTSKIPIIFISAIYTDNLNIFKGYEKGAFSFITKPFKPEKLLNKVTFFIDKHHAEKAFLDSKNTYQELYDSSPDLLLSVDPKNLRLLNANRSFRKKFKLDNAELKTKTLVNLFDKQGQDEFITKVERFILGQGQIDNFEITGINSEGGELELLAKAKIIQPYNSGPFVLLSFTDITSLKNTRKKLQKALVKLENANKELEDLVYLTSHDLQEPVHTVRSALDLLDSDHNANLNEEAKMFISFSKQATNRMKELIRGLLDYFKLGRNNSKEQVETEGVLGELIQEMNANLMAQGAEVRYQELPQIIYSKKDLKHIFQNFLSNSIKYRKPDIAPIITIECKSNKEEWIFSVNDNGIGIEEKHFGKVFQIFQQLHNHGEYDGIGLGMAMCKKIIENHEGRIWLESIPGEGTTFYFTVPKGVN